MFCYREECAHCREEECLIGEKLIAMDGPYKCAGSKAAWERYETLKAMNLLAKLCNDEGFYYNNWIYIIPDEVDDEELKEISYDDEDTFSDAVRCFITTFHKYVREGGLYIGGDTFP